MASGYDVYVTIHMKTAKEGATTVANTVRETNKGLSEQKNLLDQVFQNWKKTFAVFAVGYASVVSLLAVIRSLKDEFVLGFKAIENFRQQVIGLAAATSMFMKSSGSLAQDWSNASGFATQLVTKAEELDRIYSGTAQELITAATALVTMGVQIDVSNQQHLQSWVALAEAAKAVTTSTNKEYQVRQEIQALLEGSTRQGATLARLLDRQLKYVEGYAGGLKEALNLWKAQGIELQEIGKYLQGFVAAQKEIETLVSTQASTLTTVNRRILRAGFLPAYIALNDLLKKQVDYWTEAEEIQGRMIERGLERQKNISSAIQSIWINILAVLYTVGDVVTGIGNMFNKMFQDITWLFDQILIGFNKMMQILFEQLQKFVAWIPDEVPFIEKIREGVESINKELQKTPMSIGGMLRGAWGELGSSSMFPLGLQALIPSFEKNRMLLETKTALRELRERLIKERAANVEFNKKEVEEEAMTEKEKERILKEALSMRDKLKDEYLKSSLEKIDYERLKIAETYEEAKKIFLDALKVGKLGWEDYVDSVVTLNLWKNSRLNEIEDEWVKEELKRIKKVGEERARALKDYYEIVDDIDNDYMELSLSKKDYERRQSLIKYEDTIKKLDKLKESGYVTEVMFLNASERAWQLHLLRLQEINSAVWKQIEADISQSLESGLFDLFKGGIKDMRDAWTQFTDFLTQAWARMLAKMLTDFILFGKFLGEQSDSGGLMQYLGIGLKALGVGGALLGGGGNVWTSSGGAWAGSGFQHGGWITEPILGMGKSGRTYAFHPPELVTPADKLKSSQDESTIHLTIVDERSKAPPIGRGHILAVVSDETMRGGVFRETMKRALA